VPWREPELWIAVLLVVLIVTLTGHDRIMAAIGTTTAPAPTPFRASPDRAAMVSFPLPAGPLVPDSGAPLPDRAPRDPFRALVLPSGQRRVIAPMVATHGSHTSRHTPAAARLSGCASSYVVKAGDSLWSIAARETTATGVPALARASQRIYRANHNAIGTEPNLLYVGTRLCLPSG
jgi:nucleoid-associated protein YgaU